MTVPERDRKSLLEAVQALASDEPFVATGADPSALDPHARDVLDELRTIDRIAQFHKTLQDQDGGSAATSTAWGPLTLLNRIGTGTYGDVYRAWEPRLKREVALKLLKPSGRLPSSDILKEAQLLARVHHHHVVVIHGADEIDGRVGIWMELLRGRTLHDIVTTSGPLSVADATTIGLDLCGALSTIHQAGIVHRDVKAQNVMREDSGRIVLMDFGTGEEASDDLAQLQGTPLYTAPEVLESGAATTQADVYSLGVLLFFLVTRTYPAVGATLEELRSAIVSGPRHVRDLRPDVPESFSDAIEAALASEPGDRYAGADQFAAALRASTPEDERSRQSERRRRLRRWVAVPAGVAGLALLASGIYLGRVPPSTSQVKTRIVVGSFENQTGDASLDSISSAFERQLASSRAFEPVGPARVKALLGLMRRPSESAIDRSTARELSLRDSGTTTYVTGTVEHDGPNVVVAVEVVDPQDDRILGTDRQTLRTAADADAALRHMVLDIDALPSERHDVLATRPVLPPVTTRSLRALQLYGDAYHRCAFSRSQPALDDLKLATAEDPNFASAYIWQAWCLHLFSAPSSEVQSASDRAAALSDHVSDAERFFIAGTAAFVVGRFPQALTNYLAFLDLTPDDSWALEQATWAARLTVPEQVARVVPYYVKLADAQPQSVGPLLNAANVLTDARDFAEARRYVERAAHASPSSPRLSVLRLRMAFGAGDVREAAHELDEAAELNVAQGKPQDSLASELVSYDVALGRLRDAERIVTAGVSGEVNRTGWMAKIAYWRGDRAGAVGYLKGRDVPLQAIEVLIDTGMLDDAAPRLSDEPSAEPVGALAVANYRTLRGYLALARGRAAEAEAIVQPVRLPLTESAFFIQLRVLAEARVAKGDVRGAIAIFEESLNWRDRPLEWNTAIEWLRNAVRLAELYHASGLRDQERRLTAELESRMALADADFVLLQRLHRLDQSLK